MQDAYLEVTFRHGAVLAAYFYLPRESSRQSARSERVEPGFVIDYDGEDRPIGVELTSPSRVSLDDFNRLLTRLGQPGIEARDLAPLKAA